LRREPQLENLRLVLKPLVFLAGIEEACDTRNVDPLTSLELMDTL